MAVKAWISEQFDGGWSQDPKSGIKYSQAYTQSLDFRKSPSQMSVLPAPAREDAGVVTDLIQNEVMINNGVIYALGSSGNFYKRTTAGVWSLEGSVGSGYFGMDYRQDLDAIYLCGATSVSLYAPLSGTPILQNGYYGIGQSAYNAAVNNTAITDNVNCFQEGSTLTSSVPVTATPLSEVLTYIRYFQIDIEPLIKVSLYITNTSTGSWTVTLHDGLNNNLGSVTVSNSNLINNQFNDFVFSSPIRLSVAPAARTYHIHVTSSASGGTISSTSTNDIRTCDLELWANRLIAPINGMHPMANFQQYECIGNERYLSIWEPLGDVPPVQGATASAISSFNTEWQRHALIFPPYYQVCGLAVLNEYIAIACERIPTGTNTSQDGCIFWWDGTSATYNYFTLIPEGSPYGLQSFENIVYYYAGGAWYAISKANGVPTKLWTFPNSDSTYSNAVDKTVIYPYASTVRRDILLTAYPSTTTNQSIEYGVYSWGSVSKNYPQSFGYNYLISTGDQYNNGTNNLTIGMVKNHGDILHVSWADNGVYGIDVVNNFSVPAPYATWNSQIFDNGYLSKPKLGNYMEASWLSLPAGANVVLKYQIDRSGTWTTSPAYSATNLWNNGQNGSNYARFTITDPSGVNGGLFHEIQLGIDIYSAAGVTLTPPTITMVTLVFDDKKEELLQ